LNVVGNFSSKDFEGFLHLDEVFDMLIDLIVGDGEREFRVDFGVGLC